MVPDLHIGSTNEIEYLPVLKTSSLPVKIIQGRKVGFTYEVNEKERTTQDYTRISMNHGGTKDISIVKKSGSLEKEIFSVEPGDMRRNP